MEVTRKHLFENGGVGSCVRGTEGAKLVAPLEVQAGDHYIVKRRWSGFFQTHLDQVLRRLGVTNIVLAGVQTPNCIRGTAYDAIALDYPNVRGPGRSALRPTRRAVEDRSPLFRAGGGAVRRHGKQVGEGAGEQPSRHARRPGDGDAHRRVGRGVE